MGPAPAARSGQRALLSLFEAPFAARIRKYPQTPACEGAPENPDSLPSHANRRACAGVYATDGSTIRLSINRVVPTRAAIARTVGPLIVNIGLRLIGSTAAM